MKLAGNPRPVGIVWCEPERVYDLAELAKYEVLVREQPPKVKKPGRPPGNGGYEGYAQAALANELVTLTRTPEGSNYRNIQLNKSAYALGQLVGVGVLDQVSVEAALYAAAVGIGLGNAETRGTIKSGIEAGIKVPRELPEKETKAKRAGAQNKAPQPHTDNGDGATGATADQNKKHQDQLKEIELSVVGAIPNWPHEVMTGAAGMFARSYAAYLETPEPFLFMNYLTLLGHILSNRVTLKSEIIPQPRLYTVNLGESADTRKTTSINKTAIFFLEVIDPGEINSIWGVGSAEGLAKAFNQNPRVILILDELKAIVQKMRIDASVLLPCVNTLFELNCYHSLVKNHDIKIDEAELCLLAASTLETYRNMFTSQFLDIGFINRLFIVIGDSQRKFSIPQPMPEQDKEALRTDLREVLRFVGSITVNGRYAMPIDPQAQEIFDAWYFSLEQSTFAKRLDTYGHRLMPLLAVNEMKHTITPEIVQRTVTLLNYQLAARKFADPIDADNAVARLEERIRRLLAGGPKSKRDLEKHGHKNRVGTWFWSTAINNLKNAHEIEFDGKTKIYRRLSE